MAHMEHIGFISIHASAKEATLPLGKFTLDDIISIHASAKEATTVNTTFSKAKKFQSTPPRRRRPLIVSKKIKGKDFNPRLREGGDDVYGDAGITGSISIHASAKEATTYPVLFSERF